MKKTIVTLQDALSYQLQGLRYTEAKVKSEFSICAYQITSSELRHEIQKYTDNADNKILKLERIFNYLMQEPGSRKNEVIVKLMDETHQMLAYTISPHLKDILMVGCIQSINSYKISSYKTSYLIAVELELDTACDLLQQILEWELETAKALNTLSIKEFNKINNTVKLN